jgi:hypothetical protein
MISMYIQNRNVLRSKFLVDKLNYNAGESKDNTPQDIQEVLKRINIYVNL